MTPPIFLHFLPFFLLFLRRRLRHEKRCGGVNSFRWGQAGCLPAENWLEELRVVTEAAGDHAGGSIGKAYCVGFIDSLGWPSLDPGGGDRRDGGKGGEEGEIQ